MELTMVHIEPQNIKTDLFIIYERCKLGFIHLLHRASLISNHGGIQM